MLVSGGKKKPLKQAKKGPKDEDEVCAVTNDNATSAIILSYSVNDHGMAYFYASLYINL